jgi:hypothetical protein
MPLRSVSAGTVTVSTDASMIASLVVTGVYLQGHVSNGATVVLVGGSATQALALSAGVLVGPLLVSNLNTLYGKTSAGSALLVWLAVGGGREA